MSIKQIEGILHEINNQQINHQMILPVSTEIEQRDIDCSGRLLVIVRFTLGTDPKLCRREMFTFKSNTDISEVQLDHIKLRFIDIYADFVRHILEGDNK